MIGFIKKNIKLVIILTAILARITAVLISGDKLVYGDEFQYIKIAKNLIHNGFYGLDAPDAYRPPLYSFFIAALFFISHDSIVFAKIIQAIVGGIALIFLFGIGEIIFDKRISLLAGALYAFYPLLIYLTTALFPQTILCFLLFGSVYILLKIRNDNNILLFLSGGIFIGLIFLLVPPYAFLFLFFIYYAIIGKTINFKKIILNIIMLFFSTSIFVLPWLIRNNKLTGQIGYIADTGILNLWLGNNPTAKAQHFTISPEAYYGKEYKLMLKIKQINFLKNESFYWIKTNPIKFFKISIHKFLKFYSPYGMSTNPKGAKMGMHGIIIAISYIPILFLGIISVVLSTTKHMKNSCFLMLFIFFITGFIYSLFITSIRFRIPLDGLMIVLASFSIVFIWDKKKIYKYL